MRNAKIIFITGLCVLLAAGAYAQADDEITVKVEVSGSQEELQPLLDALREMEQRPSSAGTVEIEEETNYQAALPSGPLSGEWIAQGRRPLADGSSAMLSGSNATIVQDGTNVVLSVDNKTFKGQFTGDVLVAKLDTDIPAVGRSGKGRTKVDQVWSVHLQEMGDGTLLGRYTVKHSGFQAADNYKNSTQSETLLLRRR